MIKHIAKKVISFLCGFMDTPYFAILLVSIELFCFYFGLDLVIIGTISFFISLAFLFKKKLNCVLVIFLFMSSMISIEKSPAGVQPTSDVLFYFKPPVYIFCIICVSIPALIILCKAFLNIIKKQIRIDTFFVTCIFFAFALSMNGIFIEKTNFLNFMFGFFMLFFFIILLVALYPYICLNKAELTTLSKQASIYLLVPLIELLVFYLQTDIIYKPDIFLGWGNNNTIGFLLLIVSPLVLYLIDNSQDKKTKILAIIFIAFVFLGIILTFSRQTYLFFGLFLTFYLIYKLLKEKNKRVANVILLLFWITSVCSSFFILKYNGFLQSFGLENSETLFHRFDLWKNSLAAFKEHPLLGGGFFFLSGDPAVKLPGIMPLCSHNTFFEFLGATGLVGTICYLFYRFFGLRKVFPILNKEQFYVFVCYMLSVLISLIDIHLFDLFGTAVCTTLFVFSFSSNFHLDKENLFRENKDLSDNSGEVEG